MLLHKTQIGSTVVTYMEHFHHQQKDVHVLMDGVHQLTFLILKILHVQNVFVHLDLVGQPFQQAQQQAHM